MLIDWFTVAAQALNFLILVWLMKRFLYGPILQAIDTREAAIAAELAGADTKKADAQKESDEFRKKNEEFDRHHASLLGKATKEANLERKRLLDEAGKAAEAERAKQQAALRGVAERLHQSIGRRTQEEVFAIARKTLGDLAAVSLEARMTEVFIRRLAEIGAEDREKLGKALTMSSDPALVRSTFELPTEERGAIQRAVNVTFSADVPLVYETAPELISGIEVSAGGQKAVWSIDGYLDELEQGVAKLLAPSGESTPPVQKAAA